MLGQGRGRKWRRQAESKREKWRENLMAFVSISSSCSWGILVFRFQVYDYKYIFFFKPVPILLGWVLPLFWFDYCFAETHTMLFSAWTSLLNLRPVYPTVYWTSQLGCPIRTSNSTYPKENSSPPHPNPLLKLTPSPVFFILVNSITVSLSPSWELSQTFSSLLPPISYRSRSLSPANFNSPIFSMLSCSLYTYSPTSFQCPVITSCLYSQMPSIPPSTQQPKSSFLFLHMITFTPLFKISSAAPHCL